MNQATAAKYQPKKSKKNRTERLLSILVVVTILALGIGAAAVAYLYVSQRNAPPTTYYDYVLREQRAELRRKPKDPGALTNVGYIYLKLGNGKRGLSYLDRALAVNDKYVPALYNKGMYLKESGERQEAIEFLAAAGKNAVEGNKYMAYFSLGELYFEDKDYDVALENLKLANEDNGTIWNIHELLGRLYELKNDQKKALEHYGTAASFNPTDEGLQKKLEELTDG